jgi:hypothetical protein
MAPFGLRPLLFSRLLTPRPTLQTPPRPTHPPPKALAYFFVYAVRQGAINWLVFWMLDTQDVGSAADVSLQPPQTRGRSRRSSPAGAARRSALEHSCPPLSYPHAAPSLHPPTPALIQAAFRVSGFELGGLAGGLLAGRASDALIRASGGRGGSVGKRVQVLCFGKGQPRGTPSPHPRNQAAGPRSPHFPHTSPDPPPPSKVVVAYMAGVTAAILILRTSGGAPGGAGGGAAAALQWLEVALLGFFAYGPQLIGLCGAELVAAESVGAAEGLMGLVAYLGARAGEGGAGGEGVSGVWGRGANCAGRRPTASPRPPRPPPPTPRAPPQTPGAATAGAPLAGVIQEGGYNAYFSALLAAAAAAAALLLPMTRLCSWAQRQEDGARRRGGCATGGAPAALPTPGQQPGRR